MANPNPSEETRFQPGQSGNPGGKSKEHRQAEVRAAELAAKLRLRVLEDLASKMEQPDAQSAELIDGDVLRLLKDSEDRGFGTPKQAVEMSGNEGGPITMITRRIIDPAKKDGD